MVVAPVITTVVAPVIFLRTLAKLCVHDFEIILKRAPVLFYMPEGFPRREKGSIDNWLPGFTTNATKLFFQDHGKIAPVALLRHKSLAKIR